MLNSHIHIDDEEKRILDTLRVIQICDSNFPIGSFNHSYGMETYLRDYRINDAKTVWQYIKVFLNNVFIYSDGLAIRLLYDYLDEEDFESILTLDRMITVQCVAKESRDGSKLVAGRMIDLFQTLYKSEFLETYKGKIRSKEAFGHPAIVFGMLMYTLNFTKEEAIGFHMYSTMSTLIQNAVRAVPLGQKDGQLLVKEVSEEFSNLYKKIEKMSIDEFGASSPGIEMSQINHETLEFRLFMS